MKMQVKPHTKVDSVNLLYVICGLSDKTQTITDDCALDVYIKYFNLRKDLCICQKIPQTLGFKNISCEVPELLQTQFVIMATHFTCGNIDAQIVTENVTFIGNFFNNSFTFQLNTDDSISDANKFNSSQNISSSTHVSNHLLSNNKIEENDNFSSNSSTFKSKFLKFWGLPGDIVHQYQKKGIIEMFDWQVECLGNSKVLLDYGNLVYSAPTSAGKTLIAEILTIKTVLERQKKVIIILPFVSVVREKMLYLQDILSSSGIRVEGFMGSHSPAGGYQAVHVAICTIEKANALINKLMDEDNIADLGAVIVDEMHLLGDPNRGYILELLLTKIKYMSIAKHIQIQIVAMSATCPNIEILAKWLNAELYITQFRPVPLEEFCLVSNNLFNKEGECVSTIKNSIDLLTDNNTLLHICLDTIKESCSVLIFCVTKNWCENLAQLVASSFCKIGFMENELGIVLRSQLKTEIILEVLEQLKNCPVGLDEVLKKTVSFGVAYHHAGLTYDERDIIENGFKSGAIRVLVATSTLSSGVNLPARKVIIRTPVFQKQAINILTYKQMVGRAGRMGKDKKGESILFCSENEKKIGFGLMNGDLESVKSCLDSDDKFLRAILEVIASKVASTISDLDLYEKCTLNFYENNYENGQESLLNDTLEQLKCLELIRTQNDGTGERFIATALGKACLSSSMAPHDGLSLFCELQKARQCLVLETDLHLIYLVTPYSVSNQWGDIDWLHLFNLWESLTSAMKRVGQLVGVQESFIIRCMRTSSVGCHMQHKVLIHKRFYTALALQDLINEVPLSDVANKFRCPRGFLQSLQQSAATFAGMVTAFCRQLSWKNMEMLMSQFQDRLHFGIHVELLDLMKLSSLNGLRARSLFDAGFETISDIATADVNTIENILYSSVPFQSEKETEDDDINSMKKKNRLKNIWITGFHGKTVRQAAEILIQEARKYLEREIGVSEIKWNNEINKVSKNCMEIKSKFDNKNQSLNNTKRETMIAINKSEKKEENKIMQDKFNNELNRSNQQSIDENTTRYNGISLTRGHNVVKPMVNNIKYEVINGTNNCSVVSMSNTVPKKVNIIQNTNCDNNEIFIETNVNSHLNGHESRMPLILEENMCKALRNIPDDNVLIDVNQSKTSFQLDSNHNSEILNNISNDSLFNETMWKPIETSKDMLLVDLINKTQGDQAFVNKKSFIELGDIKCTPKIDKKICLSSLEDDNDSSLFEESLPLDLLPTNLFDHNSMKKSTPNNSFNKTNSNNPVDVKIGTLSLIDAFKDSFEKIEDNNLKLVYDDEKYDISDYSLFQKNLQLTSDVVNNIDSFHRDNLQVCRDVEWKTKHMKLDYRNSLSSEFKNVIEKSILCTLRINNKPLKYIILSDEDLIAQQMFVSNFKEVSMYLVIEKNNTQLRNLIGYQYLKEKMIEPEITENARQTFVGVAIYVGQDYCIFCNVTSSNSLLSSLVQWMENNRVRIKLYSIKYNYLNLQRYLGLNQLPSCIDILLSEWLIDNEEKEASLNNLIKKYCDFDVHSLMKNENFESPQYRAIESACINAWAIWQISEKQQNYLHQKYDNIQKILAIETQVAKILSQCEDYGLNIDKNLASQMLIDVKESQNMLQGKAYKLCGYTFNLNSSKDVAKVLGMYRGRKVSTKKSVLMTHDSLMAKIIIYWRKLNAILTKTLYPLNAKASMRNESNRIYPTYIMHTCTGRVSMNEPNLQSVPRTFSMPAAFLCIGDTCEDPLDDVVEYNCRNIFTASPGHLLVSADYCQIEMRILTHFCEDDTLMKIMKSDMDVFTSIASSWGRVSEDKVDDELRQRAKQLCYGIIYGMGTKTLGQQLDVCEMEAAVIMETFYSTYPSIKDYTQRVIDDCKKKGYVETLMKRRRHLPDIKSKIAAKRCAAERQAVNTIIQGSAADIVKHAMCDIAKKVEDTQCKAHLVLQMHDELIYEVSETSFKNFIEILKRSMENTILLNVPLPVKIKYGYAWGSMQSLN